MAKVILPLMSKEASGQFGKAMVFGNRKGQNVVRGYTIPSNPQSQGQMDQRNFVKITGAMQKVCGGLTVKRSGETKTDLELLRAGAPSTQTWNSYLTSQVIGKNSNNITAAKAAFALLTAPQKTAWGDAAAALPYPITAVGQTDAGGVAGTSITAGEVFYLYQYGLWRAGVAVVPGAVPPTYA